MYIIPMSWYFERTAFWIRLGRSGPGIMGLHRSERPLFSERNGYRRFFPKWPALWRFRFLQWEKP